MQAVHLRKYNEATNINFELYEVDGIDFRVDAVAASGDVKIMKDNGAEANTATATFVDEGTGYSLALSATEMSAARVVIYIVDQTATKVWLDKSIVIETYGHASAQHAFDLNTASTAQTGDSYARLGAPAGASVSADLVVIDNFVDGIETAVITNAAGADIAADIIAVKAETALIVADTNELQTDNVPGLIATAQADLDTITGADGVTLLSGTQASIDAIETDTGTTLDTKINDMQGGTFSSATDSLEAIRNRGDAAWTTGAGGSDRLLLADTTIATLASQTSFTLTAGSADDNAYNNCTIVVEDVSTTTQKAVGVVTAYTGSTKTITLKEALAFTIATTDKVYILAENALKSTVANRQLDVTATGAAGLDWGNVENPSTAVDLSATDIQLCDTITTYTGNTKQTGNNFTRLGVPAGADIAADIADVPTVAELNARTLVAASYFDPAADAVANVTLVATTTTNTDMVGTNSAALASVCTEARLSELDAGTAGKAANQIDIIQTDTTTDIPATITTAQADLDILTGADGVNLLSATQASIDAIETDTSTTLDTKLNNLDLGIIYGVAQTGTLSTTQATSDLTGYADSELVGRAIIFTGGTADGQASDITAYASGLLTFTAIPTAPANLDSFKIV